MADLSDKYPSVDIIIPTLNAGSTLNDCLDSIKKLDYPADKINIYIVDGGSHDQTIDISDNYNCRILHNPLVTGESAKAVGFHRSKSPYLIFIDSDNIIPYRHWLKKMINPLINHSEISGSEPIRFTYRRHAGFIERYSALFGVNDPYAFVSGLYDRENKINLRWTSYPLKITKYKTFSKITLSSPYQIPTIGANGTIYRRSFLRQCHIGDYLFDIDLITNHLIVKPDTPVFFAKVNTSIIHSFCGSSVFKFYRKQNRRIKDLFFYLKYRNFYHYLDDKQSKLLNFFKIVSSNLKFCFYTLLIIPSIFDSFRGYFKVKDFAWFFHPFACLITFFIYAYNTIIYLLGFNISQKRQQWSQ